MVQGGIASDVPVLLAADDLAPSETIQLDKSKILGFITAGGSGSSHTAILARTMGIPAIVGVGDALKPEYEGRQAIADGSTGALVIDPDDDTRDRLLKKREEQQRLQRLLETLKGQPNVTKDGKTVRIYCNIGSPEDVHAVQVNDGGGIGLFRSEFLYLNSYHLPHRGRAVRGLQAGRCPTWMARRSSSARWTSAPTSRSATLTCPKRTTPPWACAPCASA